jgi:hypothetical protein
MTCCNRTPEPHPVSTPATTDDFRYRYGAIEMPVLEDPRLTQNDKTVYATLKAHRNHRSGTAWPSRRLIGQIAGCTERAVSLATARLLEAGYLTKEARVGRSTVYSFPLTCPPADTFRGTPERTFTDNRQFSEQKKEKPQQQQPAHERPGGSVVVVDSAIAKNNFPSHPAPAAPDATPGTQAVPAAPDATTRIEAVPPASDATARIEAVPPASDATARIEAAPPAPDATARIEPAPAAPDATARIEPAPAAPDATARIKAVPAASDVTPGTQAVPAGTDPGFTFPAIISLAMQVGIAKILCGLPYADAQMLLDELAGAAQHTTIRNPIAYLRRLLSLHLSGTLIPEHAERIAALRAAQARNEAARQRALAMRLDERPPDIPKPTKPRDHSARLAAMEQMRSILGYREPGAG